jgi:predicted RNA-binding protein with PIN domain
MVAYSSEPIILVDGYNIIGAWHWLKEIRDRDGLELARLNLVETLVNYVSYKGIQGKVVFDAHYQKTPSYEEKHTPKLWIYYTAFSETADTYIERFCASFPRRSNPPLSRLIVATSDQAQRHTVVGYGAEWLSAQKLAKEIEAAKKKGTRNYRPRQKSQGRFLFNTLDPKTQKTLTQWRHGLK